MSSGERKLSNEEIIEGFNRLRQEQRGIATKLAELESEVTEHGLVIDTLKKVDKDRKCFRLVGGVLVERTVAEVLPALENNKGQISMIVDTLSKQLTSKGKELNNFRDKHNIRVRGETPNEKGDSPNKPKAPTSAAGVLV